MNPLLKKLLLAGGAAATTTVDLSNTYLGWLRKNVETIVTALGGAS